MSFDGYVTDNTCTDTFCGWTPMLVKGLSVQHPNGGDQTMEIAGVISTEATDFQGESMAQDGVDWQYFADHGQLNYNHTPLILGEPSKVIRKGDKTLMHGRLYSHVPEARRIYEAAYNLKKSGARRGYGFSVEGAVLLRACGCKAGVRKCADQKKHSRILKARVMNVSICEHPVNAQTSMQVLRKAVTVGYQQAAGIDPAYSVQPLVAQSLDGALSTATFRATVRRSWPVATDSECDALMASLLRGA